MGADWVGEQGVESERGAGGVQSRKAKRQVIMAFVHVHGYVTSSTTVSIVNGIGMQCPLYNSCKQHLFGMPVSRHR